MFRLGYRWQAAADLKLSGENASGSVDTTTDFEAQFLEVGIRYHF